MQHSMYHQRIQHEKDSAKFFAHVEHTSHENRVDTIPPNQRKLRKRGSRGEEEGNTTKRKGFSNMSHRVLCCLETLVRLKTTARSFSSDIAKNTLINCRTWHIIEKLVTEK